MLVLSISIFGAYGLLSLLFQFESRLKKWLASKDALSLLPSWSFFAPIPGTSDYRIIFRDFSEDKSLGSWNEVSTFRPIQPWRFVWNPQKHTLKCVSDCIQGLLSVLAESENPSAAMLSWTYVRLCGLVMSLPKQDGVTHRQFAIVTTDGFSAPQKSEPHLCLEPTFV